MSCLVLSYYKSILSFAIDSVITKFDSNGNCDYENNYNKIFKLENSNICIAQLNNPWLMGAEINQIISCFNQYCKNINISSLEDCSNYFVKYLNDNNDNIFDNSIHQLEMKLIFFGLIDNEYTPCIYEYNFRYFGGNLDCELVNRHVLSNTSDPFFYLIGDGSENIKIYLDGLIKINQELLDVASSNETLLFQNILNNEISLSGSARDHFQYCNFLIQLVICKKRLDKSPSTVGYPIFGGYIDSSEGFVWVEKHKP